MLDPTRRKQALEDTLEFQNKQQASAAPYNMLYKGLDTLSKLPEQISANAANRAMLTVLGAKSVTDAGNAAMANSPFGKGNLLRRFLFLNKDTLVRIDMCNIIK